MKLAATLVLTLSFVLAGCGEKSGDAKPATGDAKPGASAAPAGTGSAAAKPAASAGGDKGGW